MRTLSEVLTQKDSLSPYGGMYALLAPWYAGSVLSILSVVAFRVHLDSLDRSPFGPHGRIGSPRIHR